MPDFSTELPAGTAPSAAQADWGPHRQRIPMGTGERNFCRSSKRERSLTPRKPCCTCDLRRAQASFGSQGSGPGRCVPSPAVRGTVCSKAAGNWTGPSHLLRLNQRHQPTASSPVLWHRAGPFRRKPCALSASGNPSLAGAGLPGGAAHSSSWTCVHGSAASVLFSSLSTRRVRSRLTSQVSECSLQSSGWLLTALRGGSREGVVPPPKPVVWSLICSGLTGLMQSCAGAAGTKDHRLGDGNVSLLSSRGVTGVTGQRSRELPPLTLSPLSPPRVPASSFQPVSGLNPSPHKDTSHTGFTSCYDLDMSELFPRALCSKSWTPPVVMLS
ncbi:PREDICTED: uncharacterized protein LOC106149136 [Chinchilla lanigera]|uniref:uncharacterized protein LOC106149136 n=1 Tax=Chinchilla lanigera TaxID=34839 RepID=UPI0006981921|nr:PREDICTED: uncharacterized protein LOC106149136 [Chinchilla lanigera]